ncbi:MAG TPA: glycosyl hydrolase 108 family protein [Bacteroidia bacterium]|nr:glycosyl hydrolase 108 family protein [Bacteroidia bacterium]
MAIFNPYFEKVLKWEGGWADDPSDKGGKTNMGVTLTTWKAQGWDNNHDGVIDDIDLRMATKEQIAAICKKNYWDFVKGDQIGHQLIAQNIVDFGWGSGPVTATKRVQRVLGVADDGKIGPGTLGAINNYPNQQELLMKLVNDRLAFLDAIIARDASQKRFEKGWKRRVYDMVDMPSPM